MGRHRVSRDSFFSVPSGRDTTAALRGHIIERRSSPTFRYPMEKVGPTVVRQEEGVQYGANIGGVARMKVWMSALYLA